MVDAQAVADGTLTRGPEDLSPWTHALRDDVRATAAAFSERRIWIAEAFREQAREPRRELRCARATAHLLDCCPQRIRHGERLVGWHPSSRLDEARQAELRAADEYLHSQHYWVAASEGHMALDYPTICRLGLDGVLADLRARRAAVAVLDPQRSDKLAFYDAAETCLTALQRYIGRYAVLAGALALEAEDPAWRADLERSAAICAKVAHRPAETFREALQLVWFCYLAVAMEAGETHHCFGAGRIDQNLIGYLEAERAAGTLDEAELDDLLDQFQIKCNEFHGAGMSAVIVGVGGRRPDGSDATNELSWRLLHSSCRVRMYFPGLDIFCHRGTPREFLRAAVTLLRNGNGQPSFFNDEVIVRGLERYGVPFEHAVDHLPSTCTETSIQGRCNPWVAYPYMNLPMALLAALFGGRRPDTGERHGPDTPLPQTYDELRLAFAAQLEALAHQAVARGNADQALEARYRPFPLLSCFIRGCLESGRDISHGGAEYNFLQPEAVGVTNCVDSLAAIASLADRYSLDDFRAAIEADWAGHEALRRAVREAPKFGNDEPLTNDLFAAVAGGWCSGIEGARNYLGGPVLPGFLGWTVWIDFGRGTPATPDGRSAGEPLSNSTAPASGVKVRGVPSMLLSAGGLDHSRGLGGITINLRFANGTLQAADGPDRLLALIETGLHEIGLYMLQIDLTSSETMRAAQQRPEEHRDLLVRIGGYLVPFCLLGRDAQEEVIARAELAG